VTFDTCSDRSVWSNFAHAFIVSAHRQSGFPNLAIIDSVPTFAATRREDNHMSSGRFGEDFKPLQWLAEGATNLLDKALNALTHFMESKDMKTKETDAANPLVPSPRSAAWGQVASGVVDDPDKVLQRIKVPGLTRDQLKVEVS